MQQIIKWISRAWDVVAEFFHRRRWMTRVVVIGLYAFVVGLLGLGAWRERATILQWLERLQPQVLVAIFAIYSLALMLAIVVWYLIMVQLSNSRDFRLHFHVYCVTNLARRIPGILWHVVGRAYLYERAGISKAVVSIGSLLEAVLVPVSGMIVYFLSLPFRQQDGPMNPIWLLGVIVFGAVLVSPPFLSMLYRLMGGNGHIPVSYGNLLVWLIAFMLIWVTGGFMTCCLLGAIVPLSFSKIVYIIGSWGLAGSLSAMIVFMPSGFGVLEISFAVMLSQIVPLSLAVFSVITLRLLLMLFEIIWGIIALTLTRTSY